MMRVLVSLLGLLMWSSVWAATSITAGTDLSTVLNTSGEYELQAGTHQVTTSFTMATDVKLTGVPSAVLLIKAGQILTFDDRDSLKDLNIVMEDNSRIQAAAVSGNTFVANAEIVGNMVSVTGTITTRPSIRLGQGFNSYHRYNTIADNDFFSVPILEEVGDANYYLGNRFYNMAGLRPIQTWGSNHYIIGNYVSGGVLGISLLGKHNIAANRRPCTGNVISGNVVTGTSEEGISMDLVGNIAAETVVREYDTIATKPGSPTITLASANWVAQTTYTGSLYDLVVVSATNSAMVGRRFKITTHSGASFTLDITSGDYANLTVGDGVAVKLECYGNTIANNVVLPTLASDRAATSGIALWGLGIGNTIVNNIVFGQYDGTGLGGTVNGVPLNNFALIEASLNGITASDSVTGLQRRASVGLNTITNNINLGGGIGAEYRDYGSNPVYTPPASTYASNATYTRAQLGWLGGALADEPGEVCLGASSILLNAGVFVSVWAKGYDMEDLGNTPPIGARGRCALRPYTQRALSW